MSIKLVFDFIIQAIMLLAVSQSLSYKCLMDVILFLCIAALWEGWEFLSHSVKDNFSTRVSLIWKSALYLMAMLCFLVSATLLAARYKVCFPAPMHWKPSGKLVWTPAPQLILCFLVPQTVADEFNGGSQKSCNRGWNGKQFLRRLFFVRTMGHKTRRMAFCQVKLTPHKGLGLVLMEGVKTFQMEVGGGNTQPFFIYRPQFETHVAN